jgi:MoaA/NifB/PqqE/SkfB family radical SAM enzyme
MFDILQTYDYGRGPFTARILRNYHRYLWQLSLETIERRTQVIPCLGGRAHMAIYADGSVCPCEMLPAVGNIKAQSWREVLASPELRSRRETIRSRGCWCTHNCVLLDSIMLRLQSFFPLLCQRPPR